MFPMFLCGSMILSLYTPSFRKFAAQIKHDERRKKPQLH